MYSINENKEIAELLIFIKITTINKNKGIMIILRSHIGPSRKVKQKLRRDDVFKY